MNDAPKRIWACVDPYGGRFLGIATVGRSSVYAQVKYVRADLFAAQAAEIERLREALAHTAEQALAAEIPVGYGPEDKSQWTKGYDAAIRHARKALEGKG